MKILRGITFSAFLGTSEEKLAVKRLLTFDKDHDSYLDRRGIFYTGLIDFIIEQLGDQYSIEVEDEFDNPRIPIKEIEIPANYIANGDPNWEDRSYQYVAARKSIHKQRGIIEVATGGGKTEIACIIIKWLLEAGLVSKIYVICGTQFLMGQAASRFEKRGLEGVSRFGAGHRFRPTRIQVCVIDSLVRGLKEERDELCADFSACDVIFFDECHHLQAKSWVYVGEVCPALYRFGMTATMWADPFKFSYSDFLLIGLTGGAICHIPSSVLRKQGYLADPVTTMIQISEPSFRAREWDKIYTSGIVRHTTRNSVIISLACSLYDGGYKTLGFVSRINHGLLLVKILAEMGCKNTYFVRGGQMMYQWKPSGRWDVKHISIETLADLVKDTEQITIFGNIVLDEGIDIPSFNALIMGTAMKKYRRTLQRVGRGMRPKPGDNRVYVFDFIDSMHNTLLKHSLYRMQTYELEEFQFSASLEETAEMMGTPILLDHGLYEWEDVRNLNR